MNNWKPKKVNGRMQGGGAGNRDGDKWVDMKSYKCMIRDIYDFI